MSTNLRAWRHQAGLSLGEVAGLTGLTPGYLSRIETGSRAVAPLTKVSIARRLGVRVDEIFPVHAMASDDSAE